MAIVYIDSEAVEIADDERLNGIQAAQRVGIEIPHYCWHPGLSVVASCRMCLVESGSRNRETGETTMVPKLVPACQTPAKDGTVFVTKSEKVQQARARVEEDLLLDHPVDCPICDKAGECLLQDYHFKHGQSQRRADIKPFTSRRRPVGPTVTLFVDRCIMCSRCVRFTREISGTSELMVVNRGSHEEIDVVPGYPLNNKLAGNVVDLCPVGALGDKDFLYKQRVWFMKRRESVCATCSTGCSLFVEENQDRIYRIKPRENPHVNRWWICDDGRYGYHHVHSPDRMVGAFHQEAGEQIPLEWTRVVDELKRKLTDAARLGAVLSPFLTVEEAYLLCQFVRAIDPDAELALGPIPIEGEDEIFPNGFVIHAEKCPNRRGVERIIEHFSGRVTTFDKFLSRLESSDLDALWITGGYTKPWLDEVPAEKLTKKSLLVVQDVFASQLSEAAAYRLGSVTFAERAGSYVNHENWLQSFDWAVRPPIGVWSEGQLYWRLLNKPGLYNPIVVMNELASAISCFSPAAGGVPATGIGLLPTKADEKSGRRAVPQTV